jgi:hypothetical protein
LEELVEWLPRLRRLVLANRAAMRMKRILLVTRIIW